MNHRRLALASSLGLILLSGVAFVVARFVAPPEVQWRLQVVEAKVRGDLREIPLRNLVAWLAPGSPVYLARVAEDPNPHRSIKNVLIKSDDAMQGKPAVITRHGKRQVVVVSYEEWQRLSHVPTFGRLLMAAPLTADDLPSRNDSGLRTTGL